MTYYPSQAEDATLALSMGLIQGRRAVSRYAISTDVDTTETDIWDRANPTDDQKIWLAPTAPRIHQIVSSSVLDTAAGPGARAVIVSGLETWDSEETSEVVVMDGATNVPTTKTYVVINRFLVQFGGVGAAGINAGTITAEADTDNTITAQINPQRFFARSSIFGTPRGQTTFLTSVLISIADSPGIGDKAIVHQMVNTSPDISPTAFFEGGTIGVSVEGSTSFHLPLKPYANIPGPNILKFSAVASSNDNTITAAYGMYIVDN